MAHWFLERIHELATAEFGAEWAKWLHEQERMETTDGTSDVFRLTNNPGGLTQGLTPNKSGARQPMSEGGYYYKEYDTPEQAWADLKKSFLDRYPGIYEAKSREEFAKILHDNGYYTITPEGYVERMLGYSEDNDINYDNFNFYGGVNPLYATQDIPEYRYGENGYLSNTANWQSIHRGNKTDLGNWWDNLSDSFMDSWLNNGSVSFMRKHLETDHLADMSKPREDLTQLDPYTLKQALANIGMSEDDYKAKQGYKYEAFQNIVADSWNKEQLLALTKIKGEDFDREERVESRGSSALGIVGTIGGTLADPLNLVPVFGQEAVGVKLLGATGKIALQKLASSKMAQLAEIGLTNGLINIGDQMLANEAGYYNNNNYAMSFALGFGAGAGLSFLQRKFVADGEVPTPKGQHEQKFSDDVDHLKYVSENGDPTPKTTAKKPKPTPMEQLPPILKEEAEAQAKKVTPLKGLKRVDDDLMNDVVTNVQRKTGTVDNRLIQTLNERYGMKLKEGIDGNTLSKFLHNEADAIYLRPPKLVKLMDAYGLKTIKDMASHVLAYNKHAKTGAIKEYFEGILGGKLSNAQFMDVARHIKQGGTFDNLAVKLEDGSVFLNGFHHSPNSLATKAINDDPIFLDPAEVAKKMKDEPVDVPKTPKENERYNPFESEKEGRMEGNTNNIRSKDEVLQEQQLGSNKIAQVAGQKAETNKWLGNRYGVFINSVSKTMNKIAKIMGSDPRLRKINNMIRPPAYAHKQMLMKKYEFFQRNYNNAFRDWSIEKKKIPPTSSSRRQFNEEVNRLYDSMYNPYNTDKFVSDSIAIKNAVDAVKGFRDMDVRLHKLEGTLPHDFIGAGELWRRVDYDKQTYLRTLFKSDDEFTHFMRNVAKDSIQWKDITPEFRQQYLIDLDLSDVEAKVLFDKSGYDVSLHNVDDIKTFLKTKVLMENDDLFKEVVAGHWAEQITKRQDDLLSDLHIGSNRMGYYQNRLPMDTNKVYQLPNGQNFTFNDSLRNQDLSSIMAQVADRSSGTMALHQIGIDNPVTDLKKIYERVEGELYEAVQKGDISKGQMKRELEEVKEVFHRMSGGALIFPEIVRPQTYLDKLKRILLTESYRQNGMNFGVNQYAETIGGIGTVGARALTYYIPALHDFIHKLKYSKDFTAKQLRQFKDVHLGHQLAEHIWFNPQMKRDIYELEAENLGVGMKLLNGVENVVEYGAKITSTINQVTRMTNTAVTGIQADILPEMMMWARGERNSFLRKNLFSDRHLLEAGIDNPKEFQKTLRDRLMNLGDEDDALAKAITKWQDEDMASYSKLERFLKLASNRAVLEPDLWNTARRLDGFEGFFQGVAMQFKQFSQVALNSHLGRVLNNREREDFQMLMSTALSNGMVWATSVYFNSYKYFGDNEEKRQAYLERTLTPERLIETGLLRSSLLSGLSFANDAYEMFAGGTSNRTTVNRAPESDNMALNVLAQFPAMQSAYNVFNGATSTPDILATAMSKKEANFDPITNLFPLDRYIPMKGVLSIMADKAELERKHKREREERQQKRMNKRKETNGNVQNESILDMFK